MHEGRRMPGTQRPSISTNSDQARRESVSVDRGSKLLRLLRTHAAKRAPAQLLDRAIPSPRRCAHESNAGFRPIEAALSNRAQNIRNSSQGEQDRKRQPEKQFCGKEFAHKVSLQNNENCEDRPHALANAHALFHARYHRPHLAQVLFQVRHLSSRTVLHNQMHERSQR